MTKRKAQTKPAKMQSTTENVPTLGALEEERNLLGVQLSLTKMKLKQAEIKLAKVESEARHREAALLKAVDQQKAIKDFRTGQAQVLLATVHHLEHVVRSYADESSWAPSDATNNPDIKDKFIGFVHTMVTKDDGTTELVRKQAQGFEIACDGLSHELLQVG